ncbi:MAG: FAD-binding oxidoreductase [Alphaproteobacteria bacterium]|nr:FAD-binding oxidoreductase [Alphaproteobacteria bacterium]
MRSKSMVLGGWGRAPLAKVDAFRPERLSELHRALVQSVDRGVLARGAGRSYGDQALNEGGHVALTERLDRVLGFDAATGLLVAEPGVTIQTTMRLFLPRGWQVPVSPGTGLATLGGALANDVHGKNHDRVGSFGNHVRWFDLALADGTTRRVTPDGEPALWRATIGGMGLTGIVTALAVQMMQVPSDAVDVTVRRVRDLDDFMSALTASRATASYSVGWIDALARGRKLGRGILETAEPAPQGVGAGPSKRKRVPLDFPGFALNKLSVKLFNELYYRRAGSPAQRREPVEKFLFPLDSLLDWNRIYGKRGFHQFQCVIPDAEAGRGIPKLLDAVSRAGAASFLAVLKTLGGEGRGLLSFPLRGFTLALDLPRREDTAALFATLEQITLDQGGRIYLAKDALLSAAGFQRMYPNAAEFRRVVESVDPNHRFTSDMARRLLLKPPHGQTVDRAA